MKATVDANILFACLIREGETRKIWFNPKMKLYAPAFIIGEFLKYQQPIEKKSELSYQGFENPLKKAVSQLGLVSDSELAPFIPAATTLCKDPKDLLYFACALKEDTLIWSNDKEFKNQSRIKVRTTSELLEEAGHL
ncbi:MAG: PIN domain-containing protein [Candidatus Diapherotrites archaeon]